MKKLNPGLHPIFRWRLASVTHGPVRDSTDAVHDPISELGISCRRSAWLRHHNHNQSLLP